MSLWNIIRDWFVMYIFGGVNSQDVTYYCRIGYMIDNNEQYVVGGTGDTYLPLKVYNDIMPSSIEYIGFGDWLSTTATIIVLILMCIFLIMCVIWLFKFFGGLFKW